MKGILKKIFMVDWRKNQNPDPYKELNDRIVSLTKDLEFYKKLCKTNFVKGILWILIPVAVLAGIGWCFTTVSFGETARHNAENSARQYVRSITSEPIEVVYCNDGFRWFDCQARLRNGLRVTMFECDDDPPKYNDGCRSTYLSTSSDGNRFIPGPLIVQPNTGQAVTPNGTTVAPLPPNTVTSAPQR